MRDGGREGGRERQAALRTFMSIRINLWSGARSLAPGGSAGTVTATPAKNVNTSSVYNEPTLARVAACGTTTTDVAAGITGLGNLARRTTAFLRRGRGGICKAEKHPARVRADGGRERANRFDLTYRRAVEALKVAGGPELA